MNIENIEKKWQQYWLDNKVFKAYNDSTKEKFYYLIEFPYPSGAGLHVGHVRSYTALDAMARKKRMQGFNVLYPIGWDAFGLPAEQYAIKNKIHPSLAVTENIKVFKKQILDLGISFDWDREFATTDPEYYKWTQWQFIQFVKNNMAYKEKKEINWCPNCKVGLSNEEAEGNVCERCGGDVVKKEKEQWILKMSDYSEKLLKGLDQTEFLDRIKTAQVNWIGKSEGASVYFDLNVDYKLEVFTTRPDTLFGVTFMVISPEHKLIDNYKELITNIDEVNNYQKASAKKTEIERTDATKEKTGVKLEGIYAINPINKEKIPVFISDYVLANYGTGAIMAVPAHDQRDYDFASKFNIDIIPVIEGDISECAYTENGVMINSGFLNGIDNKLDAINKTIEFLESNKIGSKKVNYKLQDWIFSRQRFWGEPIPMVYCEDCGWVCEKEENLPIVLPKVTSYEPTDDGESPLASIDEFVNCSCPKCGKKAKRETDTMPNWAGSSWYYLRYMDPNNNNEFVSKDAMNYWNMVDYYNGGMEHATRHLLYARFWHNFLYDIDKVPYNEPFKKRVAHGMILGSNGEKMSKSKGNVVNPDDMIKSYGADALRTYEMFIADYQSDASWNEDGLKGCKKFLDRIINLSTNLIDSNEYTKSLEIKINQTIKKVSEDIENMKYNTAVSSLMILLNEFDKVNITKKDYQVLITLLNPIAPHITEELNELYISNVKISEQQWPTYDESKLIDDTFQLVVQVNGKVRGKIEVNYETTKEQMEEYALNIENVKVNIENKEIVKIIIVPKKLVNIVVK